MTTPRNPVLYCFDCNKELKSRIMLNWHREKFHPIDHLCLLCDPVNGKLMENVKIKVHMKEAHGLNNTIICGCCNYVLENRYELGYHQVSLRLTGDLGKERIVAKSCHKPGSLQQKFSMAGQRPETRKRTATNEQPVESTQLSSSSTSANHPVTTTKVVENVGIVTEDKENISSPPAKKFMDEESLIDTEFKIAQEFFQKFLMPALMKFQEEKIVEQNKE